MFLLYIYIETKMKDIIKQILRENLSGEDKSKIKKEVINHLSSNEFKDKVEKIIKDRIKNEKELEDKIVEITRNVLTQLYKTLWTKKSFWQSQLKNKSV